MCARARSPTLITSTLAIAIPASHVKIDYLTRILNAKVYDVAVETPLQLAPMLSARLGNRLS